MSVNKLQSHCIDLSSCASEDLCDSTDDSFFVQDSPCNSAWAHTRTSAPVPPVPVLYLTSTPATLLQKSSIRRLAQLLDILQVCLRRDNNSCSLLEYEVVDLATSPAQHRVSMIQTSGDSTLPQLHVRKSNGQMLCVGTIQHVEELHDFGVRSC